MKASRKPAFRECLAMPPAFYAQRLHDVGPDLDAQLARLLLEYKTGRFQQALKRFRLVKKAEGLDPDLPLIDQIDTLGEIRAPLLIFELLFLAGNNTTLGEDFWRYVEAISAFGPDDAICHGALYNVLTLFALRRSDLRMADQLCTLADAAYAECGSGYLRGFIHLHQAYIALYKGHLAEASDRIEEADEFFGTIADARCEQAMVDITHAWITAEATGQLPSLEVLRPLKEQLFAGEFWPETFVVLAALHLRAAETSPDALADHAEIEAILRIRGLTQLLPVMQLLREDHLRRLAPEQSHRPDQTLKPEPPDLPERQVLLLLPDGDTVLANWGEQPVTTPLVFPRMRAARDLVLGGRKLRDGRFDLAAPLILSALDVIEAGGWTWLRDRERDTLTAFVRECLVRRRYLDKARALRNRLVAALPGPGAPDPCPDELTLAEFGIVRRLTGLTNNKRLAREMGVTEAAVKFHLRNIYKKLGVHRRADAVNAARSRGWLDTAPHAP